jgi:phenylpropionate dioxygenase-like ring-hydroxylating dioxygenase large terminal subunit
MLNNLWYAVEFSTAITAQLRQITLMEQHVVLYRDNQGKVIALNDRCAHRGASLALGWTEENCLRCPYHGWKYDANGRCVEIPANQLEMAIPKRAQVAAYPVEERHGFVWLWWGEQTADRALIPDLPQFADSAASPDHRCQDEFRWNAHYTRVIENNVDVSHPPFLHRRMGQRKDHNAEIEQLFVKPMGEWGASVTLNAKMKKLKGIWQPLVAQQGEMGSTRRHAFYLPNFTTLELNFGRFQLAFLMAHVPVAPDVTITKSLILRNFLKFSWLDRSVNQFGQKLLREDEQVVKTQIPQSIETDWNQEILVASDAMILAYRKLYKKWHC